MTIFRWILELPESLDDDWVEDENENYDGW
jgi:hypothetical protein